ncbi:MAG TPA: hypothetical protein VD884_16185 [Ohtaekwangia sp.]|nr:hypothetical protein [Ohtaekwangia sp.]
MLFFRIGSYILILTGISHLIGHIILFLHFTLHNNFTGLIPANDTELNLLKSMNDYQRVVGGTPVSMMDFLNGLSLCYSLFFLWSGIVSVMLVQLLHLNSVVIKKISLLNSIVLCCGAIIAVTYFFWPPVLSFASAGFFFLMSYLRLNKI